MENLPPQPEKEPVRPDHGPTQVRIDDENPLKPGVSYIYHRGPKKDNVKVIGPPGKNETSFYPPGVKTIKMEFSFRTGFGNKGKSIRIISLDDLGLIPHYDGTWEQNRWLEDLTKIKKDNPDQKQPNWAARIIKRLRP